MTPKLSRLMDLAAVFNVPVENLIKEILIEEDKKRPDRWARFLFDEETNDIIDTLHLNLAQHVYCKSKIQKVADPFCR